MRPDSDMSRSWAVLQPGCLPPPSSARQLGRAPGMDMRLSQTALVVLLASATTYHWPQVQPSYPCAPQSPPGCRGAQHPDGAAAAAVLPAVRLLLAEAVVGHPQRQGGSRRSCCWGLGGEVREGWGAQQTMGRPPSCVTPGSLADSALRSARCAADGPRVSRGAAPRRARRGLALRRHAAGPAPLQQRRRQERRQGQRAQHVAVTAAAAAIEWHSVLLPLRRLKLSALVRWRLHCVLDVQGSEKGAAERGTHGR